MKKIYILLLAQAFAYHAQAQWAVQPSNYTAGPIDYIDAVDNNVVWGVAGAAPNFVRTTDGVNWTTGAISNAAGLSPDCISAISADTAWVTCYNGTGGTGKVLKTTDGGATWIHQITAAFSGAAAFPNFIHMWNANDGVCMGDPNGPGTAYFEIYTTTDGGTNWVRTPSANIAAHLAGEFGITDVFASYGDSTIWFGTNFGRIYKSSDRGLNWTVAVTPYNNGGTGLFIGAIGFKDALNGLAVSQDTSVIETSDGGITWSVKPGVNNGLGAGIKNSLVYVPGTTGTYFMSCAVGTALSPDDGLHWLLQDALAHTDMDFVDSTTGWTGSSMADAGTGSAIMYKWSSPIVFVNDDVMSTKINVNKNTGINTQIPVATFMNSGLNTQTFDVTMTISGGYSSTKTINALAAFDKTQVSFDPWTPAVTGSYTVTVYTQLTGDMNLANDTLVTTVTVYPEFTNYGWMNRANIGTAYFGAAGAFSYTGTYPNDTGYVYSFGGATATAVSADNNRFDVINDSWSILSPMPSAKYQFSSHQVRGKIYVIGGYSGGLIPDPFTYIYDIATDTWSNGPDMQIPVGDYASGVYKDSLIYYIGGFDGAADVSAVQIYNTYTNSWSSGTDISGTATSGLRGGLNGNTFVIVGGYSQLNAGPIAQAQIGIINATNPAIISWSSIADYPGGPVSRLAAGTVLGNQSPLVLFVGGDATGTGVTSTNECWAYDLSVNEWKIGPPKFTTVNNISDFVGAVYNDSLYMVSVAGYTGAILNNTNEWLNMGSALSVGIHEHSSVDNGAFSLYPNPNSLGIFYLYYSKTMIASATIKVYNSIGELVFDKEYSSLSNPVIDLSGNSKGIYLVKITNGDKNYSSKVVID